MRILVFLLGFLSCWFGISAFALAGDNNQPATVAGGTALSSDEADVILNVDSQQLAGIKTSVLKAVNLQPEFVAYGLVVSLEPLLQLRQQFLAVRAQQDGARAKYQEANLNLSRTETLHHQDIVSTRRLQEQQVQWQADKTNLAVSSYQQQAILAVSRLEWGEILTGWFVSAPQKPAEQFLRHDAQLLQITLPGGVSLNPDIRNIAIDERGHRNSALNATLISASPKVDPVSQGERYFFKAEGRHISAGAHVTAWIASRQQAVGGVVMPASALVWHLGQAFVFVKTAGYQYSRRSVPEYTRYGDGYFVTGYLQPEEEVVVTGAQTLLSQQLKALIPDEDRD
ncbi:MAG: hypothetical protein PHW13_07110 [Methylococcales bacterium]|nr:hypothetical protein [Methylococcales bacterium]